MSLRVFHVYVMIAMPLSCAPFALLPLFVHLRDTCLCWPCSLPLACARLLLAHSYPGQRPAHVEQHICCWEVTNSPYTPYLNVLPVLCSSPEVDEAKRTLSSSGGGIRSGRVTFDVKIETVSPAQRYYSVGVVTPQVRIEGCYIGNDVHVSANDDAVN